MTLQKLRQLLFLLLERRKRVPGWVEKDWGLPGIEMMEVGEEVMIVSSRAVATQEVLLSFRKKTEALRSNILKK